MSTSPRCRAAFRQFLTELGQDRAYAHCLTLPDKDGKPQVETGGLFDELVYELVELKYWYVQHSEPPWLEVVEHWWLENMGKHPEDWHGFSEYWHEQKEAAA